MGADFDARRLFADAARFAVGPRQLATAESRAITAFARGITPQATRDIAAELTLTPARIRQGLKSRRGSGYVELTGSGRGVGIAQGYNGRQTPAGVVFSPFRNQGPVRLRHAFIKRAPQGGLQAFERRGRGAPRLPVDRLYSTNIAGSLRSPARRGRLADYGMNVLATEVRRQLGIL